MVSGLRRAWRWTATFLAAAPGTYVLFLVVTVTTLVLRGVDASTATRVLRQQSTNLLHMTTDAPRVLVLSAFLLDQGHLWKVLLLFTLVSVPVERWIGTYKWLAVFAAGHVGATLATTVGIWMQVRTGVGGRELSYVVDVGVSYGVAALAGVLVFRLPSPVSWLVGVGLFASYGLAVARTGTFTDWGHLCALLIGLAMAPLVRPRQSTEPSIRRAAGLAGWWRWLATPPARVAEGQRRRAARVAGGVLLAVAAGAVMAMLATNPDVDLQPTPSTQTASVVGQALGCRRPCNEVTVRVGSSTAVLRLPAGTAAHTGSRVIVRPMADEPGVVRLAGVSRRVHVAGLLGELSIVSAIAGAVLLATLGEVRSFRRRRRPGTVDPWAERSTT